MHEPLIFGKLVVLTVGFFIAFQAYRGYVRHGSVAMRYLSVGFAFISVGTVVEGLLFEFTGLNIFLAGVIQTIISALGMLIILYSLYGDHIAPSEPDTRTLD